MWEPLVFGAFILLWQASSSPHVFPLKYVVCKTREIYWLWTTSVSAVKLALSMCGKFRVVIVTSVTIRARGGGVYRHLLYAGINAAHSSTHHSLKAGSARS